MIQVSRDCLIYQWNQAKAHGQLEDAVLFLCKSLPTQLNVGGDLASNVPFGASPYWVHPDCLWTSYADGNAAVGFKRPDIWQAIWIVYHISTAKPQSHK